MFVKSLFLCVLFWIINLKGQTGSMGTFIPFTDLLVFFCFFFFFFFVVVFFFIYLHPSLDWLQSFLHFCHSLSLPVAVFVSLIPFQCFTAETTGKLWLSQCNMIQCLGEVKPITRVSFFLLEMVPKPYIWSGSLCEFCKTIHLVRVFM